jgi:F5/8 type C domain/Pectate lyase superfamily protein/Abnormal spindle-like microcephaly-assoc'd, ASPM-SPD-2-Hydin
MYHSSSSSGFRVRRRTPWHRAAVALTLVLACLTAIGITRSAAAQTTPGADVPFTEYNAVNATTNGTILGPDYSFGSLPSEATGREVDLLTSQGEYVTFTLTAPANAVDFHYSIPDSTSGTGLTDPLSLYVNGTFDTSLSLTSDYSWLYGSYPYTNTPSNGLGHDFYNDVRTMFSSTLPAGTTVTLKIDAGDNAPWYAINTADFEVVPAATASPSGYINATAAPYDADPTGTTDSTTAIQDAINAASAAGTGVYLPQGTYLVSSQLNVNDVTVTGAGPWYTVITGTDAGFSGNQSPASNDVTVSNLSIFGNVNDRVDSDSDVNGFNGGFSNSTISNVWIQNTKVGIWVDGPCTNLTITGVRIQDTTADGVNFDGGVTSSIVENTFTRNTQDDGMAMWSNGTADTGDTFTQDTVDSPGLANNFAIYGGSGDSITNDVAQDTITQGGGIQIANRFSSTPLSGTTTVSGNLIERAGQLDPNWLFGVGAIWLYADDSAMTGTVNITNNTIVDSPYEAFQFIGSSITNVNISDNTVTNVGTFVFQDQAPGAVSVSGVTATGVGDAGTYDCGSGMTYTDGSGNSGWSSTVCGFPASQALAVSPSVLTFEDQSAGSTSASLPVTVLNAATAAATIDSIATSGSAFAQTNNCGTSLGSDGNCTINVTFTPAASGVTTGTLTIPSDEPGSPETVTLVGTSGSATNSSGSLTVSPSSLSFGDVNSGSTSSAQAVTVNNPGSSAQTISSVAVSGQYTQTNNCGSSLAAGASCTVNVTFAPTSGGTQSGTLTIDNSSPTPSLTVGLSGVGVTSTTNLALNQPITASSSESGYPATNANDGNTSTYWESSDGAGYPQTLTVNLGSDVSIGSIVLDLPPATDWTTRTETLSVLGSTNGSSYSTLVASAGYTFNPSTGNTVTISLPSGTSAQYVQLSFTANTGWTAAQISEFEIFSGGGSSGGGSASLAASPTSLTFGSTTVGSTSAAQTVTVTNSGSAAAAISSVATTGPFSQTNTCGSSLAAGANCTVSVEYGATASGSQTGTLTVTSSASNSPLSVSLTGTGAAPATPSLSASPAELTFGSTAVGSTSAAQTVTVTNSGGAAASISSVASTGPFAQTSTCGSSLAAGANCTVSVTFTPTASGSQTGTVTVTSNASNSPLTVSLAGTGGSAPSGTDLALGAAISASSSASGYPATNANDNNPNTYWESTDGAAYPQTLTVDLGAVTSISSVVLDLPPSSSWTTRTETLSVLGSSTGASYTTLVASAGYTFNPSTGNTVTIALPSGTSARFVELSFTANTGWSAAQLSEFGIYGPGTDPNLALNASTSASSSASGYPASNAVDGNTGTYWESTDGAAYPQTLTVDLGSSDSVSRIVLDLPDSTAWSTRSETLSVLGSTNGSSYSTLVASAAYTFNPSTGNTVTITFPATSVQYVQLSFTANTGWSAAQISEFQIFAT